MKALIVTQRVRKRCHRFVVLEMLHKCDLPLLGLRAVQQRAAPAFQKWNNGQGR